jgi:hypothetical protein
VSGLVVLLGCLFNFGNVSIFGFWLDLALCTGFGGMLGAWLANKKPPQTAPARWRFVLSRPSLVFILGLFFGYMLAFESAYRFAFWLLAVLLACIAFWLLVGLTIWLAGNTRHQTAFMRWRTVHTRPAVVFAVGFGFGFLGSFGASVLGGPVGFGIGLGLASLLGLALGLGAGGFERDTVSPLTPLDSWSHDRAVGIWLWIGLGVLVCNFLEVFGFWIGVELGLNPVHNTLTRVGLKSLGLGIGLVCGLMLAIIYPETWITSLACTQLAIRWHTPIQLMRFLDDARERGVLRTVGPVYQFRHARLQDRLAERSITVTTTGGDAIVDQQVQPTPTAPPASSLTSDAEASGSTQ